MKSVPLLSWDISSLGFFKKLEDLQREQDLVDLEHLASKYCWKDQLQEIIFNNTYEALVLTDLNKRILWVNDGFTEMTGYPKSKAIHNTPSFLQSDETTEDSKNFIRKKLKNNKPFKAVILNRRKNNSVYKCELHIFPLVDKKTTHFLALEREIA